jgi:hypothetical protein
MCDKVAHEQLFNLLGVYSHDIDTQHIRSSRPAAASVRYDEKTGKLSLEYNGHVILKGTISGGQVKLLNEQARDLRRA